MHDINERSSKQIFELCLYLFDAFRVLFLIFDIRDEQIVKFLSNPIQGLFHLLDLISLKVLHTLIIKQQLILDVFTRT
jgi:hypothetical protein